MQKKIIPEGINARVLAAWAPHVLALRALPDRRIIAVERMITTFGLAFVIDEHTRGGRYCYEMQVEAFTAWATWDGEGDPPGPWIKSKGFPAPDRLGPGILEHQRVAVSP